MTDVAKDMPGHIKKDTAFLAAVGKSLTATNKAEGSKFSKII